MRPRVYRHLANKVEALKDEIANLPTDVTRDDYLSARVLAQDRMTEAMKFVLIAEIMTQRGDRDQAARAWRQFRDRIRRTRALIGAAHVFLKYGGG